VVGYFDFSEDNHHNSDRFWIEISAMFDRTRVLADLWNLVSTAMLSWHSGKLFIENAVPIDHDSMHVIVGALLWLLIALATRAPITSFRPWLWLLAIIMWNETVDLWVEQWPSPIIQYEEGLKDLALTVFLPGVLLLLGRVRPQLFRSGN
jgi:hypothetical protein